MRWVVWLLGLGVFLMIAGVIRAALAEPGTFPVEFGVSMALAGLALMVPAGSVLAWRALFGVARAGARAAGRAGREIGKAYRAGREDA